MLITSVVAKALFSRIIPNISFANREKLSVSAMLPYSNSNSFAAPLVQVASLRAAGSWSSPYVLLAHGHHLFFSYRLVLHI
jgi:hypothetical protein